jgi:excisionase family DNA binding protein
MMNDYEEGALPLNDQEREVKDWYTVPEVAQLLEVYEGTVRRWIREEELPALSLGKRAGFRISAEDLDAFIEKRMTGKAAA